MDKSYSSKIDLVMKAVKIILATVAILFATNFVSAQEQKDSSKVAQVVFSVNMTCHKCEQKIKENIPFEKGVKELTTDLNKKLVTITFRKDKTDKEKLKQAIEKLGFTCKEYK